MTRWIGLVCCVLLVMIAVNSVSAEELLLQIDLMGFKDVPLSEIDQTKPFGLEAHPNEKRLWSVEAIVLPDTPFKYKYTSGDQIRIVSGKVTEDKDGKWKVELECHDKLKIGTVPGLDGPQDIYDLTICRSTVSVDLNQPLRVGGGSESSRSLDPKNPKVEKVTYSRHHFVLTLKENNGEEFQ